MKELDAKAYLVENDQQFRQLVDQHQGYESDLKELQEKSYLSHEEQVEETVLKKKKLALKDHMQALINRCQSEQTVH
ncbi:MAG: DUF465 domain-containing protein [Acidobacteriota bacterium]